MKQEEMYQEMNEAQWVARQQEMLSGDVQLIGTKKEIIESARNWAEQVADEEFGSESLNKRLASIERVKEYINTVSKVLKDAITDGMNDKDLECHGVKFTKVEGRSSLDYSTDEVWTDLKNKLKEREELLKVAHKSQENIYDSEGVEVPKCPLKPSSAYIKLTY